MTHGERIGFRQQAATVRNLPENAGRVLATTHIHVRAPLFNVSVRFRVTAPASKPRGGPSGIENNARGHHAGYRVVTLAPERNPPTWSAMRGSLGRQKRRKASAVDGTRITRRT
jgi:hypothetical protein